MILVHHLPIEEVQNPLIINNYITDVIFHDFVVYTNLLFILIKEEIKLSQLFIILLSCVVEWSYIRLRIF